MNNVIMITGDDFKDVYIWDINTAPGNKKAFIFWITLNAKKLNIFFSQKTLLSCSLLSDLAVIHLISFKCCKLQ